MVKKSVPKKNKSATKKAVASEVKIPNKKRYTVRDLPGKTPKTFAEFVNKSQKYGPELDKFLQPGEYFGFDVRGKMTRHFSDNFAEGVEGVAGSWSLSKRGAAEDLIDDVVIVKFHGLRERRSAYKEQRRKGLEKAAQEKEREKKRKIREKKRKIMDKKKDDKLKKQAAELRKLRAQLKKVTTPKRKKL